MDNSRNLLLAVLLSGILLLGWEAGMQYFYPQAALTPSAERVDAPTQRADAPSAAIDASIDGASDDTAAPAAAQGDAIVNGEAVAADLDTELASAARIAIDAPRIAGSINLVGAKIDDVVLKDHRQTMDSDSGPVRIFAPQGTEAQHFAQFGWVGQGVTLPGTDTRWQADGAALTGDSPVTLTYDNGAGQLFSIVLAVDDNYMITARQSVRNTGEGPVVVQPFSLVARSSATASPDQWIVHSGPIGDFGEEMSYGPDYDELAESGTASPEGNADWLGFSDIYWLSAIIPDDEAKAEATFRSLGGDLYRADAIYEPQTVAAGAEISTTNRVFVGAKESNVLDQYQDAGIDNFGLSIDWGWFRWFEKPILWLLLQLFDLAGNFGVAIILLTLSIRLLLFPIAQKQFASMAAMKAIQPKMKALQERYKDDKQKQQQEVMKLYKEEKVNPLAGCLPLLIQIPIFFALYKVLILAIEMRHQPFILWIKDLSAPDPAKILNLFGMLPYDPPSFLGIGILAVLLGVTMWLTFKLNPSAMDPVQQQIFNIMPWVLMFVMAPFAAGLLIYWVTNNILTLAQQSYLYSKHPQLRAQAEKDKADQAKAKAKG